jgi:hypothetical protein
MYGLPKDFDYSIFVGRVVEQVAFMEYMVWISFDADLSIAIECSYSHQVAPDDPERIMEVPPKESTLMQLPGKLVESAAAEDSTTLVLRFKGGHVLKCFDDTKAYECFKIVSRGKETIV